MGLWKFVCNIIIPLAGIAFTITVVHPLGELAIEILRQHHFYDHPSLVVTVLLDFLGEITSNHWFAWFTGGIIGLAIGVRIDSFIMARNNDRVTKIEMLIKWLNVDPLTVLQAGCLWNEEPPIADAKDLRGDALARFVMLDQAIERGVLRADDSWKGSPGPFPNAYRRVTRIDLSKFAKMINQNPKFLWDVVGLAKIFKR